MAAGPVEPVGDGDVRTLDDAALRERLTSLRTPFEGGGKGAADPAHRERLDAARRWYRQDWDDAGSDAAVEHHRVPAA